MWLGVDLRTNTKSVCSKEIGLLAQIMRTILGSRVNIIGGDLYDHSMKMRTFTLMMNKVLVRIPKIMRQMTTYTILDSLVILY